MLTQVRSDALPGPAQLRTFWILPPGAADEDPKPEADAEAAEAEAAEAAEAMPPLAASRAEKALGVKGKGP